MTTWIFPLLIISILLGLVEIFFVPGFGIFGIASFLALCVSAALAAEVYGLVAGVALLIGAGVLFAVSFYFFFRSPLSQLLVLNGSNSTPAPSKVTLKEGMVGISASPLHPTGKGLFVLDGRERSFDVISESEFMSAETPIVVSRIDGFRVTVRKNNKGVS